MSSVLMLGSEVNVTMTKYEVKGLFKNGAYILDNISAKKIKFYAINKKICTNHVMKVDGSR